MERVTVATFNDPEKAEPLKTKLDQAGVNAEIHDEKELQKYWYVSESLAGIRVRVHPSDFQKAKDLLKTWGPSDGALRDAVRCPQCGSSRIQYPQFTRKFALTTLIRFAVALGIMKKEFYCEDCQHTWPPHVPIPR